MGNSWDGQVDKYIHINIFALKLSKACSKAGLAGKLKKGAAQKKMRKAKVKALLSGNGHNHSGDNLEYERSAEFSQKLFTALGTTTTTKKVKIRSGSCGLAEGCSTSMQNQNWQQKLKVTKDPPANFLAKSKHSPLCQPPPQDLVQALPTLHRPGQLHSWEWISLQAKGYQG